MKLRQLMLANAIVAVAAGLAFSAYGPMLLRFYGVSQIPWPVQSDWDFWRALPFTRVFGATLVVLGGFLGIAGNYLHDSKTRRAFSAMLGGAYIYATLIVGIQQIALWETTAGMLTASAFLAMAIGYGYCWFVEQGDHAHSETDRMRDEWSRQIQQAAAQQERNRLARDLHDSIKQQLFSINISAAAAEARWESDREGARTAIEDVRQSAHEAMTEMEAMLQHLRPAPLENVGLIEALRKQCEALQYRTGAQVATEFGDLPENKRLPLGTQEAVFRIAQEALANIARHARARNVQLRLYQQVSDRNGLLWLKIMDDGNGFDPLNAPPGLGLANLRERAREIGGTLQLESSPGAGAILILRIPLAMTEREAIKKQLRFAVISGLACVFVCGLAIRGVSSRLYEFLLGIPIGIAIVATIAYISRTLERLKREPDNAGLNDKEGATQ
ncbi:MAG: sensor histidine kinase [Blastocatellia bacterium]